MVNDTYGHEIGDMILKMVADRLLKIVRDADTVSRIGGDEFLIIQTEVDDNAAATRMAEKILCQLAEPFDLGGITLKIEVSIGISLFPTHGDNLKTLMRMADSAMYKTKARGKRNYTFYRPPVARKQKNT